ncbi:MAG: response regulator [Desulfobulbaceae bacterium]|nr:response regulator [Desulfobulbaceae bacterium]
MHFGIRGKLITIFIFIKVIPLVALAWFAMDETGKLGSKVAGQSAVMEKDTREIVSQIGDIATRNSITALDTKSRENIELLTIDTARNVASFLYERDEDILIAGLLDLTPDDYRAFLSSRRHPVIYHPPWELSEDGSHWQPSRMDGEKPSPTVMAGNKDNEKDFHYRPPKNLTRERDKPLYLEITFVDLNGKEKLKQTTTDLLPKELRDISKKENTWCKAETYFKELKKLAPGEIYVSEMIGPYLPSPVIGPYTKTRSLEKGIPFAPEKAAYAGKENPVGKRFQGLIRWATPVVRKGKIIGYVTLALDHTHIMEFTDHIVPTAEHFSDISDAASGNYAFMWDYQGRNISHPRDYFIVGYDKETGNQAVPWLSSELYDQWQKSGLSFAEFQKSAPQFHEQSLDKKPAPALTKAGMLGLDGRYLNFAPQCSGWHNLTQYGGAGSFVIFWSKLWKLTTAATIPYYTGIYKNSPRGFGYVTIGANVHEFHRPATETATQISAMLDKYEDRLDEKSVETKQAMDKVLTGTTRKLILSTLVMAVLVILIAIWMASTLTRKITVMIQGITRFQEGDLKHRLQEKSSDEMGQLAQAFNRMSDKIQESIEEIRQAKDKAEESDRAKSLFLANMSHEIRTPLNGIMGLTDLLLNSKLDDTQCKHLRAVKVSSDRLFTVINDILDFSKIEAGKLDLHPVAFNLHEALDSVLQILSIKAQEKNLTLDCFIGSKVPDVLIGDPNRLLQIIINLVNNGIKFTKKGSITIQVSTEKNDHNKGKLLRFTVTDTGIGIPSDKQTLVFQAFSQADSSHIRQFGGTGLGLSISSELAALMGGSMGLSSEQGNGSTFWFTARFDLPENKIPDDRQHKPPLPTPFVEQKNFRGVRVLMAEDELINSMMVTALLEEKKMKVTCVANGRDAVAAFTSKNFDLILMDVQMPGMDGFEATRKIREHEAATGAHVPIIALTAHAIKGYREKCITAGMDAYISKPIRQQILYSTIEEQLKQWTAKNEE